METRELRDDLVVLVAEAIVHAEWLRLEVDERPGDASDVPAEKVILQVPGQTAEAGVARVGRTGGNSLGPDTSRPVPIYPPHHVRATQRSPPHRSDAIERCCEATEVMP